MEWTVVTVLVALAGLIVTVATPLIKNAKAMTELTVVLNYLSDQIKKMEKENAIDHKEFHDELDKHDDKIADHETRLTVIEKTSTTN